MTSAARLVSCFGFVLLTVSGCTEDEDDCADADALAQYILEEAERDGLAPESVCADPDRPEKYDEPCEQHAELLAACDD